jgi:outer membrane protein OmpA-like peptidoglycan-associated protein
MPLAFDLQPEPKKKLVIVKDNRIEILQQVHFATGKATILADSFNLLNQVLDAMVKSGIKRIRIEGHTDNRGAKAVNLKLSEDRAKSVGAYLTQAGIDASRIEAVGYGDTRPVAPNLTARGRELNRRVEFVILDR